MTEIPLGAAQTRPPVEPRSFYEAVGGHETFVALVDRFYDGVADDPVLRPLYPEEDSTGARERLRTFLEQYWGLPDTDSAAQGNPTLRVLHAGFHIGPAARDAWLSSMRTAVDSLGLPPQQHDLLWHYFDRTAHSLLNSPDDPPPSPTP